MPPHINLMLELADLEAERLEARAFSGEASLESLMSEHAMAEMAASCTPNCSCCVSCCCCC